MAFEAESQTDLNADIGFYGQTREIPVKYVIQALTINQNLVNLLNFYCFNWPVYSAPAVGRTCKETHHCDSPTDLNSLQTRGWSWKLAGMMIDPSNVHKT